MIFLFKCRYLSQTYTKVSFFFDKATFFIFFRAVFTPTAARDEPQLDPPQMEAAHDVEEVFEHVNKCQSYQQRQEERQRARHQRYILRRLHVSQGEASFNPSHP